MPPTPLPPDIQQEAIQAVQAYIGKAYEPGQLPPFLSTSLRSGSLPLLSLIRILGDYLTSEDERIRSQGVQLLAQVVLDLSESERRIFDKQTVKTLSAFFAEKVQDASNVAASIARATNSADKVVPGTAPSYRFKAIPEGTEMLAFTLQALTKLVHLDGFGSEQTQLVARAIINHTTPRDHPQLVRFFIYGVVDALLAARRNALKSMGKGFLKGYIQLAEGEKDPRNLMYLFAMDRVLLIEWELDVELAEEFFDITYCYFPITFKPPPDDPYGITTQDLKVALRNCLTANPMLAPHAMPLLLEKLAASGGNTKRDTLETLEHAMPVFGSAAILANQKKLWEGFKVEIMAATDEETSVYAQKALASFLRVLYGNIGAAQGLPDDDVIATRIVSDALNELEAPEKSLAKPATDLLVSMVKACPATAHLAVYALLDQMLTMFKDPEVVSIRAPILGHIATILRALREVYATEDDAVVKAASTADTAQPSLFKFAAPSTSTTANATDTVMATARTYEEDGRPLDPVRDELLSALSNGIRSPSYRSSALLAFVHLTHIPTFLTPAETNYMAESVNELILSPSADDVRGAALDGLRDIARVNPRVLEETTLPLLFARLPDRMPPGDGQDKVKGVVRRALGALARLCHQEKLFDMLVVKLFTKLELTCATPSLTSEERDGNVGYVRGLLTTVLTVLEEKVHDVSSANELARYGATLPSRLFSLVLTGAMRVKADEEPPVATDEKVIRDVGRLLTVLVRTLAVDKQTELAHWMYGALLNGDVGASLRIDEASFQPLEQSAPVAQRNTVYVFAAALIPLSKAVALPVEATEWLSRMLQFILTCTSTLQADAGYRLLASGVNKHLPEPLSSQAVALIDAFWHSEVHKRGASDTHREGWTLDGVTRHCRAIRAWFWLCKGLMVRNSKQGEELFERARVALFSNTASPYVAKEAAKCTGLVAQSDDGILSKENGAVVRLLWKQKFFAYLLPRIIDAYNEGLAKSSSDETASINLIALSSVLSHMPRQTTKDRLAAIFPLLIRALDLEDASARQSACTTLTLAAAVGKQDRDASIRSGANEDGSKDSINSLDLVESHLTTLTDRLLYLCKPSKDSPPATRIAALRCLGTIARTVPYTTLKSQQSKVCRALNGPHFGVDDPKKEVRVQAVDAKAVWHAAG